MLSILGNIKISEPIRLKYLFATLKSYEFIKDYQLLLNIDTDIETFFKIDKFIREIGFKNFEISNLTGNYGEIYCSLLDKVNSGYVFNFFEDHFILLDNKAKLKNLLLDMHLHNVDVCKSSFWQIEQNSKTTIFKIQKENCIFLNDLSNFNQYQKYYGSRYYIGVNFITTFEFAKRFWNRHLTRNDLKSPHTWEIARFSKEFIHVAMIPDIEIMASIDDSHGCEKSNLLERKEDKFWNIYNAL